MSKQERNYAYFMVDLLGLIMVSPIVIVVYLWEGRPVDCWRDFKKNIRDSWHKHEEN